ncbi:MAG TPA: DUF2807 domain-containing protein [Allosphingosinicella sp.]|nr:DUF2807 domain-containing protein [Allosphingosinicella sp.]
MSPRPLSAFALLSVLAAAPPASAAETVALPRFDGIELKGGGSVVVRPGAVQRVTLVEGGTSHSRVRVEPRGRGPGRLVVDACKVRCPGDYRLRIEIVTPDLSAVAVHGGGRIDVAGGFSPRRHVAAAVNGGGQIDLRALPALDVAAAVNGGGHLRVRASSSLAAAINGGGAILYWGDPRVTSSIRGGGAVTKGR